MKKLFTQNRIMAPANMGLNLLKTCMVIVALFTANFNSFGQGVSFSQWANETPGSWIPGALIPNNSQYYEGTATLQRLVLVGIPTNGPQTLEFRVLAKKGNVWAYDYVTGFDQAFTDFEKIVGSDAVLYDGAADKQTLVETGSYPNPATQTIIHDLYTSGNFEDALAPASDYPANGVNARAREVIDYYDGLNYSGNRAIRVYGLAGEDVSAQSLKFERFEKGGSDTYGVYTLKWTSNSNNILILMAGHLAIGQITAGPFSNLSYGITKGSSSISGGPYHFKLDKLNGASLGNQDNQIQAGAINPPPTIICDISDITGSVCSGSSNDHTASATSDGNAVLGATYVYEITSANATITGGDAPDFLTKTVVAGALEASSTVSVVAGSGDYTLKVTITKPNSTFNGTTCNTTVTVAAKPDQPTVIIHDGVASLCGTASLPSVEVCSPVDGTYIIEYGENYGETATIVNNSTDNLDYPNVIFTDLIAGFGFRIKVVIGDCSSDWTDCDSNDDQDPANDFIVEECLGGARKAAPTPNSAIGKVENKDLSAYPVPFSESVTVEFKAKKAENYVINLYDLQGHLVRELKAGNAKAGEVIKVEVSGVGMAESMYLVRKVSKSGISTVKLLKKE